MTKELKNPTEASILKQYDLASKGETSSKLRPALRSSIMYLERYWELLRLGGRLITVIDDTLLSSSVFGYVRDFIRKRFIIRAIISLPGDTFRRSGSRVKTSVLVLERKRSAGDKQPSVFTFFSECLGVDDLTPRASDVDIQAARRKAEEETKCIRDGYAAYLRGEVTEHVLDGQRVQDRLDLKYCAPLFGRMAKKWKQQGIEVKRLDKCVTLVEDAIVPVDHPNIEFTLIKVTYDGVCEVERKRLGALIKAKVMYRVRHGQLVFSTIRATNGAIGIVPPGLDGALVSGSYSVFDCGNAEDTAYLWAVLRSHEIRADMQSLSSGSGRYTSYWPGVGSVLLPWVSDKDRHAIGTDLLHACEMERRVQAERDKAMERIRALGVESPESIKRWESSKAPQ